MSWWMWAQFDGLPAVDLFVLQYGQEVVQQAFAACSTAHLCPGIC